MRRLAIAVFLVTGAVNLQLPLYGAYAEAAELSAAGMSLLLAGYVAALLTILVPLGGISDVMGRRPVVLLALACSTAATALVWAKPDTTSLAVARWLQGFGVALVMGAATAWMAERSDGATAARVTGFASTAGFGFGGLVTSGALMWSFEGAPLSYPLWSIGLVGCLVAVTLLAGARPPVSGARLVRLPAYPTGTRVPGAGILLGWLVSGIVVAVLPGVMRGLDADPWAGVALFLMLAGGAAAQIDARHRLPASSIRLGAMVLPVGVALLALGVAWPSVPLVLLGAVVAGTSTHGWLYVGGLARVAELAPGSARAVSGFFLFAYLGFGAPAVLMGAAVDQVGAAVAFGGLAVTITLGGLALLRAARPSASRP